MSAVQGWLQLPGLGGPAGAGSWEQGSAGACSPPSPALQWGRAPCGSTAWMESGLAAGIPAGHRTASAPLCTFAFSGGGALTLNKCLAAAWRGRHRRSCTRPYSGTSASPGTRRQELLPPTRLAFEAALRSLLCGGQLLPRCGASPCRGQQLLPCFLCSPASSAPASSVPLQPPRRQCLLLWLEKAKPPKQQEHSPLGAVMGTELQSQQCSQGKQSSPRCFPHHAAHQSGEVGVILPSEGCCGQLSFPHQLPAQCPPAPHYRGSC